MRSTKQLLRQHAKQRDALRARQEHELASRVCSNPMTTDQQARRFRLPRARIIRLRRVWRSYDPIKVQPWEVWL
jgi:hypothetical protein